MGRTPRLRGDSRTRSRPDLPHAHDDRPHGPRRGHEVNDFPRRRSAKHTLRQPRHAPGAHRLRRLLRHPRHARNVANRAAPPPARNRRRGGQAGRRIYALPACRHVHDGTPTPHRGRPPGVRRQHHPPQGRLRLPDTPPRPQPLPHLRMVLLPHARTRRRRRRQPHSPDRRTRHERQRAHARRLTTQAQLQRLLR